MPPSAPNPSPKDILAPHGKPIGTTGSSPTIRELPGGQKAADDLFDDLTDGAIPANVPSYPGTMFDLPGGGQVGIRPKSKSGAPTFDVDIPGIPIKKIKFV